MRSCSAIILTTRMMPLVSPCGGALHLRRDGAVSPLGGGNAGPKSGDGLATGLCGNSVPRGHRQCKRDRYGQNQPQNRYATFVIPPPATGRTPSCIPVPPLGGWSKRKVPTPAATRPTPSETLATMISSCGIDAAAGAIGSAVVRTVSHLIDVVLAHRGKNPERCGARDSDTEKSKAEDR